MYVRRMSDWTNPHKYYMEDYWNFYFEQIEDYFSVVKDLRVLELSSFTGIFWPYILKHQPLSLEGLDPADIKEFVLPNILVHKTGYENFLPNTNYDVIICFGLVYKLSNPLDLIERIANSNSKYVIFEQISHYNDDLRLEYLPEKFNVLGNLVVDENYKKVPWNLLTPVPIIVKAFELLGYSLVKYKDTETPNFLPKEKTCVLLFKNNF